MPRTAAWRGVLVLVGQLAFVGALYRHTLDVTFLSDAWVFLDRIRDDPWAALTTPTGYHYQPVSVEWVLLVRAVFGEDPFAFQAVNLAQLAVLSLLTYLLGCRLLGDRVAAVLASVLVAGNASFYEATYWPLAGNMHLLAAQLYVAAVLLAHDLARGRFPRTGPWMLAMILVAATFSHPAMVTALPACAWTAYVGTRGPSDAEGPRLGGVMRRVLPGLAVSAVLFALSRLAFASAADVGPRPSLDPMRAYWMVSRGLVAAFSLRGSNDALHTLTTLGSEAVVPGRWIWLLVAGWLAVGVLGAAAGMFRGSHPGFRVLVGILAVHLPVLGLATEMSSRQNHVPAVAAALITAGALRLGAARFAPRVGAARPAALVRQAPAAMVALLLWGASRDHVAASALFADASRLSRALTSEVRDAAAEVRAPITLTLVNMPGYLSAGGLRAPVFWNGLHEQVRSTGLAVAAIELFAVPHPNAPASVANLTVPAEAEALRRKLGEVAGVVLLFRTDSGITRLPVLRTHAQQQSRSRPTTTGRTPQFRRSVVTLARGPNRNPRDVEEVRQTANRHDLQAARRRGQCVRRADV